MVSLKTRNALTCQHEAWGEYFKFVRIGEDQDDVEQYGWGFQADIGVQRSIYF
jgi:hypothetical protein